MFIYVLTNKVNGKAYVGQDSGLIENLTRVKDHFSLAQKVAAGKKMKYESKLIPAILKYGAESFIARVDSSGYTSKEELDKAEVDLIIKLDAIKNGYNIMPGGQGFIPNRFINDPDILKTMLDIRSRGAKAANAKRWANASEEDRMKIWESMKAGRASGKWQKNVKASWDRLSSTEREARGNQMKQGRTFRFVLIQMGQDDIIETNLRTLLGKINNTPVAKKEIERLIRNENKFTCKEFSIEKRKFR